jgi:thiosulfate reductase cytochrome b subunit
MRLLLHSFFRPRLGRPGTPAQVGVPPSDGPLDEASATVPTEAEVRHSLVVRITHWINALCFLAFIESGTAILLAYPRLHWGETGTVGAPAKINLPLPFVLELGIRGPGRSIHFLTAWVTLFCGLTYLASGLRSAHFYRHLVPQTTQLRWNAVRDEFIKHLSLKRPEREDEVHYNLFQRVSYLGVVFVLMPFMFWTGLAMSPSVTSVAPFLVDMVGGHQSARTLHFFSAILLVLFLIVHVAMVIRAGFWQRCRAMITGYITARKKPL